MEAIAQGKADCTLICNYQLGKLDDELQHRGLTSITTGHAMNFTFAVRSHDDCLYAIMNKTSHYVPDSAINSALVSYSYDEKVFSIFDYLQEHMVYVLSAAGAVLAIILLLLLKSLHSERKAKKSLRALKESLGREEKKQQELDETKDKAYTDPLTGVKSKNAYVEASGEIQQRIAAGEMPEFAIIVFDVNDLKHVNDFYGHEAGDRHILSAKKLICDSFKHSPVYRIGGDEFTVILTGEDFEKGIDLLRTFDQKVEYNLNNGMVVVSSGYAQFNPETDASFGDVFNRADDKMYQRKRYLKGDGATVNPSVPASSGQSGSSPTEPAPSAGQEDITIECDGVQIRASGDVTTDKLSALIGTLRS